MSNAASAEDLFDGGGEMGERMRAFDWAASALGPPASWPQSLRTCVRIILTSRQPMFVWWGDQLINLYNDAYKSIVGGKHPRALGQQASEVWREIWDQIRPRAESAMQKNEGTYDEALLLIMHRYGYAEETYYTFSYSPVPNDQGGAGGILCANTDDTQRILGERQLALLRDLAAATVDVRSSDEASSAAARALATNQRDLPLALIYLFDEGGRHAHLAGASGIQAGHRAAPASVDLTEPEQDGALVWPLAKVRRARAAITVDLDARLGPLPSGAWDRPVSRALVLPLSVPGQDTSCAGALVVGLSPYRLLDDSYRRFLDLLAVQISSSLANVRAFEEEKRRAEALAELDRAKTAFFSNVSHEFRTPLTLMLGPLQDALAAPDALPRENIETAHRNALRLLKLVNALLDFSRIEAGRAEASYEPTDLTGLTAELASAFQSAVERAGLSFKVDCASLPEAVYVDHDMWEKIVLNLLSNALKFTFEGSITVALRPGPGGAELTVRDTGTGIPVSELPNIFKRFHRIHGARSRTHEGSGIGLALVNDLVHLHGGAIHVSSEPGVGTTFTITVPYGSSHLPKDRVSAGRSLTRTGMGAAPYVEEARRWVPKAASVPPPSAPLSAPVSVPASSMRAAPASARILLADDNADMREYVSRLLRERWLVEAVSDGAAALEVARRRPPDLVLTDVMMPGLDGFQLLHALRAEGIRAPVIMLSARAGEESRVEGLEAGADDYLVKPFSARELIARVQVHLQLAALRAEAEHERQAAERANRAKDEFLAMLGHELRNPLAPIVTALALMRHRDARALEKERKVIERQVDHLVHLVDDLLDVSRITRGKIELKRDPVDIAAVVEDAVDVVGPLLERHRHHVSVDVPRGLIVAGDSSRLSQVLTNVLTNAAKYTPPGGHITVRAGREGDGVVLHVRDDGIGIAPDILPHIFDLFVQERQAIDRAAGGLGLGLAIVRNLVELHGGRVTALSEGHDRGTEIVIELPAALPVETPRPAALLSRDSAEGGAAPRRILIVDDNRDAAEMLHEWLESEGFEVRAAHDGLAALEESDRFLPDVVLLDIGLPVLDGYEVARRLRERPAFVRTPLIAVTGYGQADDRRRSAEAGFRAHLVKPIRFEVLRDLLTSVLEGTGAPM